MVLTDRQRADLHAGIYEYLCSRPELSPVAETMRQTLPDLAERYSSTTSASADSTTATATATPSSTTPLLEKKWTAIPRLQKKVLELEKHISQSAKIHAHRTAGMNGGGLHHNNLSLSGSTTATTTTTRMLPRLPPTHVLNGHSMVITCCALHPIYTIAISGSEDGTIKVWDHESGDYIRTLKGHTNTVNAIQFSPRHGHYLVSCSTDLSLKLWDVQTYQCLRTLRGHDHTISAVCFIPYLGASDMTHNDLPDPNNNNKKTGTGVEATRAVSQFILSASRDATVKCWDLETGFCDYTMSHHTDWVRCLAVRPSDGSVWASAGNDTVIYVVDTRTKQTIGTLRGHEQVIESIAFVTEEAASNQTTTTTATSSSSSSSNSKANQHMETIRNYLVSGSRDRSVKLWNISESTGTCIATFQAHENWVRSVVLHPTGLYILSSSDDKTIRIFDIKNNRCLRTLDQAHQHFITCLAIHPTLPILISGSVDQTLRCWLLQ